MARGVWVVPVEIDGSRLRLIVDTGAERTLLTEAAVARLAMSRDARHETRTFGIGGVSTTQDAIVSNFAIGGTYLPVPRVTVGQFALPTEQDGELDGLLGADILSAFDVDLDTRTGRLTLYRARNCPQDGPPWREAFLSMGPVGAQGNRLLVPFVLDGTDGVATLDTGAQNTAISAAMAERVGVGAAAMAQDPSITAHGAAADELSVRVHRFRLLRIGPAEVSDPPLPIVPAPEGLGDGLVGADFLAGRRIWLSYASLRVFITPLGAAPAVAMAR
jgi:predicted aspartyl protease